MAKCDVGSAQTAGVSCRVFYRLQAQVADQTGSFRQHLRGLQAALGQGGPSSHENKATAARLDRYMGKGTSSDHVKIAHVEKVLFLAERVLRDAGALTKFDKEWKSGGENKPGYMVLGNELETNTILHEAIHHGTAPWRSAGGIYPVLDLGNGQFFSDYGSLAAAAERSRFGWERASISAASYAWAVTGP